MPTQYWAGATGAWDLAGNWAGSGGAAIPVDGDTVRFTGSSVVSVTSGLTLGAAGDSLVALNVAPAYTGDIGSSGSKLIAAVGITTIRMASRGGGLFVNSAATTDVFLSATGGRTAFFEFAGTATNIYAENCTGSWSITNGAAVTNIRQSGSQSTCTIGTGVTALNKVFCLSGQMLCSSAITGTTNPGFLHVANSTFTQSVGAVTNALVGSGGVLKYNSDATLATVELLPGATLDLTGNVTSPSVTITTLIQHPGARFIFDTALNNVVVTTHIDLTGRVGVGKTQSLAV